jgi:hypothetical protein
VRERQAFLRARRAERKARKECAGADQHT